MCTAEQLEASGVIVEAASPEQVLVVAATRHKRDYSVLVAKLQHVSPANRRGLRCSNLAWMRRCCTPVSERRPLPKDGVQYMPERPDVIVASFRRQVHMIAKLQLIVEDDAERLDLHGHGQNCISDAYSPDMIHLPQLCRRSDQHDFGFVGLL